MPRRYRIETPGGQARRTERQQRQRRAAAYAALLTLIAATVLVGYWLLRPAAAASSSDSSGTIDTGGQDRAYRVHLPPGFERREHLPLVLVFHGHTQTVDDLRAITGFDALADKQRFVAAYPEGFLRVWAVDDAGETRLDDPVFIGLLVERLERDFGIDSRRVYAAGFSQGGFFAQRLACTLPDRFAAVASVAGTLTPELAETCAPPRAVPVMFIHGTADRVIPYEGGRPDLALTVPAAVDFWAAHNGCEADPAISEGPVLVEDGTTIRREEYSGCRDGANVVLLAVEGGGHTWPGGLPLPLREAGLTSQNLDASAAIWQFFQQHTLAPDG